MAFPVEKLDLELALKRVKSDLNTARSFIESPLEIELVDADQATWLSQLSEKIAAGYRPHSAVIADIPKGNGAVRPAALLNLEDRVVYAAAVGALLSAINLGLGWSQGKVDFSYRLSESVRRVEWFTNRFNGWSAFRKVSVERIDNGAAHVVLTDITGFYENIDLTVLFSDLRTLGADSDVIQLLQLCLNRWAVVPNRGVPQGLSASDVLAKVYLNP
ncbi:MAG: reverse transcriptase domain-containing protein, partial [Bradyrhizobium sp.]